MSKKWMVQCIVPWWSWIHGDYFTGDGVDDYGTEIPLLPLEKIMLKIFLPMVFQLFIM